MVEAVSASEFAVFGLAHVVTLGVFVVVAAALVIAGRWFRGTLTQWRLSRILGVVFATILVLNEVYWLWPGHSQVLYSLPLQLCDVAAMASVWALWSQSKTPFALTYFWGLTLTSHGYHSEKYKAIPVTLPSQWFVFQKLQEAIRRDATVIMMRGEAAWKIAVPELLSHRWVFTTRTKRTSVISPRNCPKGWERAVEVIEG